MARAPSTGACRSARKLRQSARKLRQSTRKLCQGARKLRQSAPSEDSEDSNGCLRREAAPLLLSIFGVFGVFGGKA